MNILLVDDDRVIRRGWTELLRGEGHAVTTSVCGEDALASLARDVPDLVLLDVMMPGMNGFCVCREIRKTLPDLPVVFLTAKDAESDELRAFGVGADDFLSKTQSDQVVLARIAAIARRVTRSQAPAAGGHGFPFGAAYVDTNKPSLRVGRREILLTVREVEVLRWFSSHPGEVCSIDFLMTRFWGAQAEVASSAVHMFFNRIREKLGREADKLVTLRGQGYLYDPRR